MVWWAPPLPPAEHPRLVETLDDCEQTRLSRLAGERTRGLYLAGHALTRLVLADRLDVPPHRIVLDRACPCGAQHGKPRLRSDVHTGAGSVHFSLTHSGDLVGVAVADDPVGLDVEALRPMPVLPTLAERVYSPSELARLPPKALRDMTTLLTTWTRKEAVLKATGEGLRRAMTSLTVSTAGDGALLHRAEVGSGSAPLWVVDLRPATDHVAALAGPGTEPPAVMDADGYELLAGARRTLATDY